MQVKCPKCTASLRLTAPPASGKVKCPKCSTVLRISGDAACELQPNLPQQQPVPDAGFPDLPALDGLGDFDFDSLPDASSATAFPTAVAPVAYTPPPAKKTPAQESAADSAKKSAKKSGGNTSKMLLIACSAILVLALIGIAGLFALGDFSGGGGTTVAPLPPREPPAGYTEYSSQGSAIFLPHGTTLDTVSGDLKYKSIVTAMGTVFFMGSAEVGDPPLQGDALAKKIGQLTSGEAQVYRTLERNGYHGNKAVLTKASRFAPEQNKQAPMINLEVFQDDGRLILIGVAQGQSRRENVVIGESLEPELEEAFYESFQIGPKPAGFFN